MGLPEGRGSMLSHIPSTDVEDSVSGLLVQTLQPSPLWSDHRPFALLSLNGTTERVLSQRQGALLLLRTSHRRPPYPGALRKGAATSLGHGEPTAPSPSSSQCSPSEQAPQPKAVGNRQTRRQSLVLKDGQSRSLRKLDQGVETVQVSNRDRSWTVMK